MKNIVKVIVISMVVCSMIFALQIPARAQDAHFPTADTYTDNNNRNDNHGAEQYLLLDATGSPCSPTTWLWYKFAVPSTTRTIETATFYLVFNDAPDSSLLPLELRSSSDSTWAENGLTYNTQPALDPTVLATSPSVADPGTVEFTGDTLADYLDAHKGQTVTLVVRADCSQPVGFSATRIVRTKENPSGSDASIEMEDPTAVAMVGLKVSTQPSVSAPVLVLVAVVAACPILAWLGARAIRRRKS